MDYGNANVTAALADLQLQIDRVRNDMDTGWLILGGILVFFMQTGFAMLEVGSVNVKNTKNILIKNMSDAAIGSIMWYLIGYGVAFGDSNGGMGGKYTDEIGNFALQGDGYDPDKADFAYGYSYASWFFQFAFAATTVTIVSGAIAERVSVGAYIIYAIVLSGTLYPNIVHWGWNTEGWATPWNEDRSDLLLRCGAIDFAGSGVVHMTGGVAALMAAIVTGPRLGRYNEDGTENEMPQQSPALQTLGTLILWFCWYGFNGMSTLYLANYSGVAAKVCVTTTIAAGSGAITNMIFGKVVDHIIDQSYTHNGILGGLVAITAGCSVVEPEAAVVIGFVAAFVYQGWKRFQSLMKIDDVIDAAPVHMANGAWGLLAAGLFATEENYAQSYYADRASDCCGAFYGCGGRQFGAQIIFFLAIWGWVAFITFTMFNIIKYTIGMRVSEDVEAAGMDVSKHGGHTFNDMALVQPMPGDGSGRKQEDFTSPPPGVEDQA